MRAIKFTFKTQRAKRTFAAVDINVCYADQADVQLSNLNDCFRAQRYLPRSSVLVEMSPYLLQVTTNAAHDAQLIRANDMSKDPANVDDGLVSKPTACIGEVDQFAATVFWIRSDGNVAPVLEDFK